MYKLLLCLRYLTTRRIALVSVISVMLGVATMIVVNAVMGGFRHKMMQRLQGILADVLVEARTMDGFPDPPGLVMGRINEVVGDKIRAMTPAVEVFGLLSHQFQGRGAAQTRGGVRIIGIEPKGRAAVGEFAEYLMDPENRADPSFAVRGEARNWRDANADLVPQPPIEEPPEHIASDPELRGQFVVPSAIVGYQIATVRTPGMNADHFLIQRGHEIVVTTVTAGKPKPTDARLIVVDYFKSDMSEYDSQLVFMPLRKLQQIRGMGDRVTTIQIKLSDYADATFVKAALQEAFPSTYCEVETWEDKQGPLLQAVRVEAAILNIILFFIIAVAGFGILSIFFMIVVEKTRDIGILKALGASDRGVMGVFLAYGLTLGLIGCGLGIVFGVLFTLYINPIEKTLTAWTGYEVFPRDIYYFADIPTQLDVGVIVWVTMGALAIAVGASVLPARRAARLRPVEALRYE
jgi:lipoprotein-releasing system permease protein